MSVRSFDTESLKIDKAEVFGTRRTKSTTHAIGAFPGMQKLSTSLVGKLPGGCRIAYTYKSKSGLLTFPSVFFKRVAGKSHEFVVVQSGKKQKAIMIANIVDVWIDKSSVGKKPIVKDTTSQLIDSMKKLEKKLDRLLRK